MNTKDVDVIGEVLRQALASHQHMLEVMVQERTADHITAEHAKEVATAACTQAEDRLREFLQHANTELVATLQRAAAEELTRQRHELDQRTLAAGLIQDEVSKLQQDLANTTRALAEQPDADEVFARLRADEFLREELRGHPGKDGDAGNDGAHGAGIEAPVWAPGVYREGTTVQAYFGQFYRAVKDTTAEPYRSGDWQRIGAAGFHFAEPYAEGRVYEPGDLFVRDFGTFVQSPTGAVLLAGRGPKGEAGPRGEKGRDGTNGKDGKPGAGVAHLELRDANLALVTRNADGIAETHTVDLIPLMEKLGELVILQLAARP